MKTEFTPTIRRSDIDAAMKRARVLRAEALGDLVSETKAKVSEFVHGSAAATGTAA